MGHTHGRSPAHNLPGYDEDQLAALKAVQAFNQRMADAFDAGHDLSAAVAALDPDPLRYMSVEEGSGHLTDYLLDAERLLSQAPRIEGFRLQGSDTVPTQASATTPSVAVAADGETLLAWIEWREDAGEHVCVGWGVPGTPRWQRLDGASGTPRDCFRPTVAFDADGAGWLAYAVSDGAPAAVHARRLVGDTWGESELVSQPGGQPAFNQELAAHGDGRVECVWQALDGDRHRIFSRTWRAGSWGEITALSPQGGSCWDPSLAVLPDGGTACAWSAYRDGGYVVQLARTLPDGTTTVRDLTSGSDYALHPSVAAGEDGRVYVAFDVATLHGHGGSGPTRLVEAARAGGPRDSDGMLDDGTYFPRDLRPDVKVRMRVVAVDGDTVLAAPDGLGDGFALSANATPRLVATRGGGLSVAYRVLRQLPLMCFYWDVVVQSLERGAWSPPTLMAGSDGGPEEAAVAAAGDGVLVCWQSDGRRQRHLDWTEGFGGWEQPHLRDHYGEVVWHGLTGAGQVRRATVPAGAPVGDLGDLGDLGPGIAVLHSDERVEVRRWYTREREQQARPERYSTRVDGQDLQLYWGDLHRHSLVSRCTAADEPDVEDFYHYARDVCEYDFWALTDHAENTTPQQWWRTQKIADLFRSDGVFVPLHGFEWTAWSGHLNVIYGETQRPAPIFSSFAADSDTPAKLWAQLDRFPDLPVITVPHHPGSVMTPYDWDYGSDTYLRLAEVFQSCRGSYESDGCFRQYRDATLDGTFVVDGLRRGHRFGLVASSDHGFGSSYVGAYAPRLDRASVFEALRSRRTIGATTRDITLDVRVAGRFMGEEVEADGPVTVDVRVEAYADVARIDVVRGGLSVHAVVPEVDAAPGWVVARARVDWRTAGAAPVDYDFSGALRVEGGSIVPTPHHGPEVVEVTADRIAWSAGLRGLGDVYGSQCGGVEVTLVGPPDAVVRVETRAGGLTTLLRDLAAGHVAQSDTETGRLRVQPGVGGLTSLGARSQRVTWTDPEVVADFYYARAVLVDGEMAWSSPVWVDRPAS